MQLRILNVIIEIRIFEINGVVFVPQKMQNLYLSLEKFVALVFIKCKMVISALSSGCAMKQVFK